jgi:hypothetical protein
MKFIFLALSLASALITLPASAQQGPAGVPGAPGLAPMVQPAPAVPQAKTAKRPPKDCSKSKDVERCKAKQEAQKIARESCKGKTGSEHKKCMHEASAPKTLG